MKKPSILTILSATVLSALLLLASCDAGEIVETEPSNTDETPSEAVDTTLDTPSETEADTTPYFDPSSLELNTYQGMTPDIPYTLSFYSYGDGTCMVSGITINILYEGEFTVEIPETSPEGDTVIRISLETTYNIPTYILAEDFEKIKSAVFAYHDFDENNFYYKQFMSYFQLYYAELAESPEDREEMISYYPLCEYVPVYAFDPTATSTECALRLRDIKESAPWYTAQWCYFDLLKTKAVADELGVTDPNIENSLKEHNGSFHSVADIKLPKTLFVWDESAPFFEYSVDLYSLSRMGIEHMIFNGTVAEMTAIAAPANITVDFPLVIHCTDGDISYPTKN